MYSPVTLQKRSYMSHAETVGKHHCIVLYYLALYYVILYCMRDRLGAARAHLPEPRRLLGAPAEETCCGLRGDWWSRDLLSR